MHDHCAKGAHRSAIRWPRESGHGSAGRTSCGRSRTRCSCCALLDSEVADRLEYDEEGSPFVPGRGYPQAHDVALDVATGICVEIHAVGGPTPGLVHDVRILAVDEPYGDELFVERGRWLPRAAGLRRR